MILLSLECLILIKMEKLQSKWLFAAGIYNILWGLLSVFLPNWQLELLGIKQDLIVVLLWQCIGMIVGVYGIGYFIAAFNPKQHWPIVLVGLLGKIFGILGMIYYILTEAVPIKFGLTCCANDLIWVPAFTILLVQALRKK